MKENKVNLLAERATQYLNEDQANQKGIENLKTFFGFLVAATMMGADILEDKKVEASEVFSGLFSLSVHVPGFFKSLPELGAEFKDLSHTELEELNSFIKDRLDLKNEEVEEFVEDTLGLVERLAAYSIKYIFNRHKAA